MGEKHHALLIYLCFFVVVGISVYHHKQTKDIKWEEEYSSESSQEVAYLSVADVLLHAHEVGKDSLSSENVLSLMEVIGVEHPDIVLAQMLLESGHFQSSLARNNNNYFGMKHPTQRATLSHGKKGSYALYKNWAYSVLDYAIWQRKYASGLSKEEYLNTLSRKYAEDTNYCSKLKKLIHYGKENY